MADELHGCGDHEDSGRVGGADVLGLVDPPDQVGNPDEKRRHEDDGNLSAFKFFTDATARSRFTAAEARVLKEILQKAAKLRKPT